MADVSSRDLRNHTAEVLRRVEPGERLAYQGEPTPGRRARAARETAGVPADDRVGSAYARLAAGALAAARKPPGRTTPGSPRRPSCTAPRPGRRTPTSRDSQRSTSCASDRPADPSAKPLTSRTRPKCRPRNESPRLRVAPTTKKPAVSSGFLRALCRTRTGDPFLTMAVRCTLAMADAEPKRLHRLRNAIP